MLSFQMLHESSKATLGKTASTSSVEHWINVPILVLKTQLLSDEGNEHIPSQKRLA